MNLLETPRLLLKKIGSQYCTKTYLSWLKDKEVMQYLEFDASGYSLSDLLKYLQDAEKEEFFFAIHIKSSGKHIGNVKIHRLSKKNLTAEYGILLGDKNEWGKGYANESTIAIINYVFNSTLTRKILLGVINENVAAKKLYDSLGFREEGLLKENFYCPEKNIFFDEYRMALFKNNWKFDNIWKQT